MPEFKLRSWQEQTLYDCHDYIVTADTLEKAIELLKAQQEIAQDTSAPAYHDSICTAEKWQIDDVHVLDPDEIVNGDSGVVQIDDNGDPIRPAFEEI